MSQFRTKKTRRGDVKHPVGSRRSRYWTMSNDRLSSMETKQLEQRAAGLEELTAEIVTKMTQLEEAGAPNWMLKKIQVQLDHNMAELAKVNAILGGGT